MPELPEVQTVVNTLSPMLVGRQLQRVLHLRKDIVFPPALALPALITGRTVAAIHRRAKRIVLTLDDGNRWFIHLGMTGQLVMDRADAPVRPHTHLVVDCEHGRQLRFVDPRRFGGIFWLGTSDDDENLGPEPLMLRTAVLYRMLRHTHRHIKIALLDQRFIAGIGNIYADEALFAARIHPLAYADRLGAEQAARLNRAIKRVLNRAISHGGSSLQDYIDANGNRGSYQLQHKVYDRRGQPCTGCRTPIRRIVVGQRSTHFCPQCQRRDRRCHLNVASNCVR